MQPILSDLFVHYYRGLSSVVVNDIAPVSLIFGESNIGKTSLLEAAHLALRITDKNYWLTVPNQRFPGEDLISSIWSMFPRTGMVSPLAEQQEPRPMSIQATIRGETCGYLLGARVLPSYTQQNRPVKILEVMVKDVSEFSLENLNKGFDFVFKLGPEGTAQTRPRDADCASLPPVVLATPGLHYTHDTLVRWVAEAIDAGHRDLLLEVLRLFDDKVLDIYISTRPGQPVIRVRHQDRGGVGLWSFGSSTRRAVALALSLVQATEGLLIIDDIDTHLPRQVFGPVIASLVRAAKSAQVHILASTRSQAAIPAVIQAVTHHRESNELAGFRVHTQADQVRVQRYSLGQLKAFCA